MAILNTQFASTQCGGRDSRLRFCSATLAKWTFYTKWLELGVLRVALLTQLYFVWHLLFAGLAPELRPASPLALSFVMFCFITLYLMQVLLCLYPKSRLSLWLYPWVYHGFYLDETFTRLTFKYWPVQLTLPTALSSTQAQPTTGERV